MTTARLLWGMTWRGGALGLFAGTMLGTTYGALFANALLLVGLDRNGLFVLTPNQISGGLAAILVMALIGMVMGGLFGVPTGFIVGLLNGLFVGLITRLFFYPLQNARLYRWTIGIVSGLFVVLASLGGFLAIALFYANASRANVPVIAALLVIPALIAGIAAVFLSRVITRWYEKESAK